MTKEKVKYSVMCGISAAAFIIMALTTGSKEYVDMIMPSMYILQGMTTWYVLLLGLIAETIVVKWFTKESGFKAVTITLFMNLISMVLGYITLHLISLIVELMFFMSQTGTFHIIHWIPNFIFVVLFNAWLEKLVLKLAFKLKIKKSFSWLCLANAISLMLCFLLSIAWNDAIYFY